MKKISIFSTFYSIDRAYSLALVVEDQLRMFVENGYDVDLIVTSGFKPDGYFAHEKVHLKYLTEVPRSNEGELPPDYEQYVKQCANELRGILKETEVCITHDVIYQPAHIIFNLAARVIAGERENLRWLHWIHSATSLSIRCNTPFVSGIIQQKFPNSFVVYPNSGDIPRVARNFKYEEDEVKRVHHPTDIPDYLGFHEISKKIWKDNELEKADIICTYPIRLDRGKQVEHVIKTIGALHELGLVAKGIIIDFHSTGGDKVTYRQELKEAAKNWGVEKDIIFVSDISKETEYSVPRQVVRDMMLASNIFMLPSTSETYSFIAQEAMICKNFIILNKDFPIMRSIYGDYPLYRPFSSAINVLDGFDGATHTKYENEKVWYHDLAQNIRYYLERDQAICLQTLVRKTRNPNYIFKMQLEPLLYAK